MSGSTTRECGSFSSVSNTGEVEEELLQHQQLQYHNKKFPSSPPKARSNDDDLQANATPLVSPPPPPPPPPSSLVAKKKRNLPGTPDPNAEVIALSPKTLMATNRFVCEICHKGFQRDQNLQLHRRGHNLPWKLRQRGAGPEGSRKRVYVCPEPSCVHHSPSRALGDLTGIKKHYCRKHGEKKWKCERCGKKYAVHSDWKAHGKVCGTREYKCDCGTVFSRRDSFVTHRAFCDALAHENNKLAQPMTMATVASTLQGQAHHLMLPSQADDADADADADVDGFGPDMKSPHLRMLPDDAAGNPLGPLSMAGCMLSTFGQRSAPSPHAFFNANVEGPMGFDGPSDANMGFLAAGSAHMSATALLQKAAEMGATTSGYGVGFPSMQMGLEAVIRGYDRPPTVSPFGPGRTHGPFDGLAPSQTQLVGLDGGRLPGQLYNGAGHGVGAMTRAIGSLMSGGHQAEHRRADDVRVVDYMGVTDHRSFEGLSPFGPYMGPWA